jgi:hypothetical protein
MTYHYCLTSVLKPIVAASELEDPSAASASKASYRALNLRDPIMP